MSEPQQQPAPQQPTDSTSQPPQTNPQDSVPEQPMPQPAPKYGAYAPQQPVPQQDSPQPNTLAATAQAHREKKASSPVKRVSLKIREIVIIGVAALLVGAVCGGAGMYAYATPVIQSTKSELSQSKTDYSKLQKDRDKTAADLADYERLYGTYNSLNDEVDDLKGKVSDAQDQLDALNGEIDKVKGDPIQLPAGEFTVGKDVPAGRYIISGDSNFATFDTTGRTDINTILGGGAVGSGDYHGYLPEGYYIKNYAPATLTPVE